MQTEKFGVLVRLVPLIGCSLKPFTRKLSQSDLQHDYSQRWSRSLADKKKQHCKYRQSWRPANVCLQRHACSQTFRRQTCFWFLTGLHLSGIQRQQQISSRCWGRFSSVWCSRSPKVWRCDDFHCSIQYLQHFGVSPPQLLAFTGEFSDFSVVSFASFFIKF